jgi:hypothetical protein
MKKKLLRKAVRSSPSLGGNAAQVGSAILNMMIEAAAVHRQKHEPSRTTNANLAARRRARCVHRCAMAEVPLSRNFGSSSQHGSH